MKILSYFVLFIAFFNICCNNNINKKITAENQLNLYSNSRAKTFTFAFENINSKRIATKKMYMNINKGDVYFLKNIKNDNNCEIHINKKKFNKNDNLVLKGGDYRINLTYSSPKGNMNKTSIIKFEYNNDSISSPKEIVLNFKNYSKIISVDSINKTDTLKLNTNNLTDDENLTVKLPDIDRTVKTSVYKYYFMDEEYRFLSSKIFTNKNSNEYDFSSYGKGLYKIIISEGGDFNFFLQII